MSQVFAMMDALLPGAGFCKSGATPGGARARNCGPARPVVACTRSLSQRRQVRAGTSNVVKRGQPADILLVEDNPSDVYLTEEALRSVGVTSRLHVASDGVEAMAFLRREGMHAEAPRPDIVLLDLNLPRKDGRRVLVEIKEDEALRRIPIIVLTTSNAPSDVVKCYDLHANCYIVKPVDFDQFETVIRAIEEFWFGYVTLPKADL